MSIASEITRINNNIASAYSKVEEKGGTLPETQNSANLATAIDSISGGGGDYNIKADTSKNISGNSYGLMAYIAEIGNIDTSNITSMTKMFTGCQKITEIPLLNTQNVTSMVSMFADCSKLTTVPLFNTQNVTSMSNMFARCSKLTTVPLFNTQNVTSMSNMFNNCSKLTTVPLFNTQNVTDMGSMFSGCQTLTEIPLFNTQNVSSMYGMFTYTYNITTIPQLNTQNVTNMRDMFYTCTKLTNESLNNILKMCIDAVNIASSNKTLKYIGLTSAQATTCQSLSNYQDFLNAGWTTGY